MFFFFQAEDGIRDHCVTGVQTCALPICVILDPTGARLEPGEILVAPSTDPGWTPLFLTAAGLVMEMGGAMSHGAVVAREYGIPAVVGVAGATEHITSGQHITVDGSAGTIILEQHISQLYDSHRLLERPMVIWDVCRMLIVSHIDTVTDHNGCMGVW